MKSTTITLNTLLAATFFCAAITSTSASAGNSGITYWNGKNVTKEERNNAVAPPVSDELRVQGPKPVRSITAPQAYSKSISSSANN